MNNPQPSHYKYEPQFHGLLQGVVIGEHNNVTLVFQDGEQRSVPFLAPPKHNQELVGRNSLLLDLKQTLLSNKNTGLLALVGLPGIGKTALAVNLAHDHDVLAHFSDGVLWAGLGQKADRDSVVSHLSAWGAALGILGTANLSSIEEWAQALHAAIGTRQMLLVVDDAWKGDLALAFKIGGPNCAHVLTTRLPQVALDFAGGNTVTVRELSEDEGIVLLTELAPTAVEAEPDETRELVRAVGGLPLALTLMGNYLRKEAHSGQPRRIQSALQRLHKVEERIQLEQEQSPLEQHPSLPPDTPLSLHAAIRVSHEALGDALGDALVSLQPFGGKPYTFSEQAALEVSEATPEMLDALSDSGLLEAVGPERYTLHETVHDYIGVIPVPVEVFVRMVRHYLILLTEHQLDYSVLEPEMNNILLALHIAGRDDIALYEAFVYGANDAFSFLNARGQFQAAYGLLHRAVEIARTHGYKEQESRALRNLGILADLRRDFDVAEKLLLNSLDIALDVGDKFGVSSTLLNLGVLEIRRNNDGRGEEYLLNALVVAREIHNPTSDRAVLSNLCNVLTNLSSVAMGRGEYVQARDYLLEARPLAAQGGALENIASVLRNLGSVEHALGNKEQADVYLEEGLALARQTGNGHQLHQTLSAAAHIAFEDGDKAKARQLYNEAMTYAQRVGDPFAKSSILKELGWLAYDAKNYAEAEGCMQQALALTREFWDKAHLQDALIALVWVIAGSGNPERAEPYMQEALTLAREAGDGQKLCMVLINLGKIMRDMGDYAQAGNFVLEAKTLAQGGSDKQDICALFHELGKLAMGKEDYPQAEQFYMQGLEAAREVGHIEGVSVILQDWAMVAWKQEDYGVTETRLQQSVEVARGTENRLLLCQALLKLGLFYLDADNPDAASIGFNEVSGIAREEGSQISAAWALYGLARSAHVKGDNDQARQLGLQSLETFEALGSSNQVDFAEVKEWLGSLSQEGIDEQGKPSI